MNWRAKTSLTALALTVGILTGCAGQPTLAPVDHAGKAVPDSYVVVRGDTLYGIAWRYGLDFDDIVSWNQLSNPDLIFPGQQLRLKSSATSRVASSSVTNRDAGRTARSASAATLPEPPVSDKPMPVPQVGDRKVGNLSWQWPTDGEVVRGFAPDIPGRKGIQIAGGLGETISAASEGQVVYSGSGLPGYGRLIIVKHSDALLSAYGYLGKIFVQEGERVQLGQPIAEMGTSSESQPLLHFEIRQDGKPVNPLRFLPS